MLLRVTVAEGIDFLPQLKTGGKFYRAPKTLHKGEALEVQDDIGYALLANEGYKGCFEVIQNDPIKDSVDNEITKEDVMPQKRKRATKDIKTHQLTHGEAAMKTAAEHSELAAEKIAAMVPEASGDKNGLKNGVKPGDGHDAVKAKDPIQVEVVKTEVKK